jgi:hypothetical protein
MKKTMTGKAAVLGLLILGFFTGCAEMLGNMPSPARGDGPATGMGRALVSIGDRTEAARTLLPDADYGSFSYTLTFTSEGRSPVSGTASGAGSTVELEAGIWDLAVTGRQGETEVLEGYAEDIEIQAGETTQVTVPLKGKTDGDDGFLSYSITFPDTVSTGWLRVYGWEDGAEKASVNLLEGAASGGGSKKTKGGSVSLPPGYYRLGIGLSKAGGMLILGRTEFFHIYPGLTTGTEFDEFEDGDFLPADTAGVSINPGSATVGRGQTKSFSASVEWDSNPAQPVSWTVEGGVAETTITNGGLLTVAANESAGTLTVRATLTADSGISGTAAVTVVPSNSKEITGFSIGGVPGSISGTNITVIVPYNDSSEISSLQPAITVSPNATVSPLSGEARDFTGPVTYTVTAEDSSQETYTVTVKNSRAEITAFSFANPPATGGIDHDAGTISVTFTGYTDVSALVPAISVSPGASVDPASGTERDFSGPVEYTVTAENGSTTVYTVTVVFLPGRGGPVEIVFPVDGASGALAGTTPITLSKTEADEQTLTVIGTFDRYRWRVDGVVKGNSNTIVLKALDYRTGVHQISVEVTLGGIVYSKTGSFTVQD